MSYSHLILNMILVKEGLKTNQDLLDVEPFTKKTLEVSSILFNYRNINI